MKAKAAVRLNFPTKKHLEIVFKSLKPEAKDAATTRSWTILERRGTFLTLKIEAKDTVALRAALNAYLRWINSVLNVLNVVETT
jgi:tRNA threonylcarbamoyladenosine modification (KEOPS) complex  Pcc1 subunit